MEVFPERNNRVLIFNKEDVEDGMPKDVRALFGADIAAIEEDDSTVRVIKNRKTGELGLMPLKFFMEEYNESSK